MNRSSVSFQNARGFVTTKLAIFAAALATLVTGMFASGAAAAQSTLGSTIAGEIAGGEVQMGLVFAAVAVLLGLLLVWSYIRRSAK